jgi:hypothetical protein
MESSMLTFFSGAWPKYECAIRMNRKENADLKIVMVSKVVFEM